MVINLLNRAARSIRSAQVERSAQIERFREPRAPFSENSSPVVEKHITTDTC